jgi:hypothetical protein
VKRDFDTVFRPIGPAARRQIRRRGDRFANAFVTHLSRKIAQRRGFLADSE